jgi:hypothetical protein
LDFFRSRIFSQSDGHRGKYRLTRSNIICRPKEHEGLEVEVLDIKKVFTKCRCVIDEYAKEGTSRHGERERWTKGGKLPDTSYPTSDFATTARLYVLL